MDFTDFQMALTVAVVLTAAGVVVCFDQWRKHHRRQQPQRIKSHSHSASRSHGVARQRPIRLFDATPQEYAPARKMATERPLEPLVGVATPFRPPVRMRERETVTVEMAPPPPSASSPSTEAQQPGFTLPPFTIDAALWERLISSQPKQKLIRSFDDESGPVEQPFAPTLGSANTVEAAYHMIQEDRADGPSSTQSRGMIPKPALEEMLEGQEPFTGLVVCIGINESDSSMWHSHGLMQSVGSYITGLLKANDFSCRTSYDEFVMVCAGEQGAQSQRRLNHISERLWDYQLRGMGACSILFSWGGVEVQDKSLAEAIASATERMRETKRSGRSAAAHRQAV
jgi:hypothetical protein